MINVIGSVIKCADYQATTHTKFPRWIALFCANGLTLAWYTQREHQPHQQESKSQTQEQPETICSLVLQSQD